jgi:D-cysteine desulfhydrase
VSKSEPALIRAFPVLRQRCPRRPFTTLPTPVEVFPLDGVPEGGLYVKRDDRSGSSYGGNKPRKLEFIIGAALARGARRLFTSGGLGTHHGLATTILGREAGLATTLVLVPQPVTEAVRRSLLLHAAYGADMIFGPSVPAAALRGAAAIARAAFRGERPYLVATGGSSTAGTLGFVSAGLELAEQVRGGELPEPSEVWVAVGSGGTLAGLAAGLRLAGLASRVVGVLVTDILPPSERGLARAATAALRRLRALGAEVPELAVGPSDFDLLRDQVGPGYGAPTAAGREAIEAAARCGVGLESTYTGKALAALRQRARRAAWPDRPVLFWNTFSSVDVEARAPRPLDPANLPARFRRILEERPAPPPDA